MANDPGLKISMAIPAAPERLGCLSIGFLELHRRVQDILHLCCCGSAGGGGAGGSGGGGSGGSLFVSMQGWLWCWYCWHVVGCVAAVAVALGVVADAVMVPAAVFLLNSNQLANDWTLNQPIDR